MKLDEVNQGLASGAFILVDVRNVDELKSNGKIPGSVNMPRKLLLYQFFEKWHSWLRLFYLFSFILVQDNK